MFRKSKKTRVTPEERETFLYEIDKVWKQANTHLGNAKDEFGKAIWMLKQFFDEDVPEMIGLSKNDFELYRALSDYPTDLLHRTSISWYINDQRDKISYMIDILKEFVDFLGD